MLPLLFMKDISNLAFCGFTNRLLIQILQVSQVYCCSYLTSFHFQNFDIYFSDSNDEDDEIQVELQNVNNLKPHNIQNSSNNKYKIHNHRNEGKQSKSDKTNCDTTIDTNERNRDKTSPVPELDDNDRNELVDVDDSCEIVETTSNRNKLSTGTKRRDQEKKILDTKNADKELNAPKVVHKMTGVEDKPPRKGKSNILDKDDSSSTNETTKDKSESSQSVTNKSNCSESLNGKMTSKSSTVKNNKDSSSKEDALEDQKPWSSTNTDIQTLVSSDDINKPLESVSFEEGNQVEGKQKSLSKDDKDICDNNSKAGHKKHNDFAEIVSDKKNENINKLAPDQKYSSVDQLGNKKITKESSNNIMKTNFDNKNELSKCANDTIEEFANMKKDKSKACLDRKIDTKVIHANKECDKKNEKDVSAGSIKVIAVENLDDNNTIELKSTENNSEENKLAKEKSENVAMKTKSEDIIDKAITDSSSIILSEVS